MKVRELVQDLLLVDQDLDVYLSSDAEGSAVRMMDGNGFGWTIEHDWDSIVPDRQIIVLWPVG